jgi:hypothetical protein
MAPNLQRVLLGHLKVKWKTFLRFPDFVSLKKVEKSVFFGSLTKELIFVPSGEI